MMNRARFLFWSACAVCFAASFLAAVSIGLRNWPLFAINMALDVIGLALAFVNLGKMEVEAQDD